jgi:hypothetical protein
VIAINFSLYTIILYFSVRTSLVYNYTKCLCSFVTLWQSSNYFTIGLNSVFFKKWNSSTAQLVTRRTFYLLLRAKKRQMNTPKWKKKALSTNLERQEWNPHNSVTHLETSNIILQRHDIKFQWNYIYMKLSVTVHDNYTDTQTSCAQQRHSGSITSRMANITDTFSNSVMLLSVWHIPGKDDRNVFALFDPFPPTPGHSLVSIE